MHKYDAIEFEAAAKAHAEKLTFNTREEYLAWVKQWKEEYRYVSALRRIEKLQRFTLPDKIKKAEKQIEQIEKKIDPVKAKDILRNITDRIEKEYGLKRQYYPWSTYSLIMYLLVSRKASKIRAAKKREERIAAEQALAV